MTNSTEDMATSVVENKEALLDGLVTLELYKNGRSTTEQAWFDHYESLYKVVESHINQRLML